MRDTARVADGKSKGDLEKRVIEVLCLRTLLQSTMESHKYKDFRINLTKDFHAITRQAQGLRDDVRSYLRWQARVIPEVDNIDDYIVNQQGDETSELLRRRHELKFRCDSVFETMCLVVALAVCATNVKHSDAEEAIGELGFSTSIGPLPIFDAETISAVTGVSFVLWLVCASLYTYVGTITGMWSQHPQFFPDKIQILRFSILLTFAFAIVMSVAIKMKRRWRKRRKSVRRSEAIRVAFVSYFSTVWINMTISYVFIGTILTPVPYMFAINQALLGYFIAKYVDRALAGSKVNFRLAIIQGTIQGIVAGIAAYFAPNSALIGVSFGAIEWFFAGCLSGILFQYAYGKAVATERVDPVSIRSGMTSALGQSAA